MLSWRLTNVAARGLGFMVLCAMMLGVAPARSADPDGVQFFESKIRPVLVKKCYSCHSTDAKIVQAGLLLDTRAGVIKGGDSGPAVVSGKPDESPLIQALRYEGYEMPPDGKLADSVIADFEKWVTMGAPDPRPGKLLVKPAKIDIEEERKFWCFQPLHRAEPPTVADAAWPTDPLDRFVLEKLEDEKLRPSADAAPATLVRRLYFDLIGLPPPPEVVSKFVADPSSSAYAKLVDELLASPHFGERWGRHWLDVARFAESSGGGRSLLFKEAWRYRDYVIDSYNVDKPFDQFVLEQLAGDLLEHRDEAELERHLVATTYLQLGAINYEEQDKKLLDMDIADEQIEAVGKGLLGMTIGCARCHDHKFDPIPTKDYYALAGIFRSTRVVKHDNVSAWIERPLPMESGLAAAVEKYDLAVKALKEKIAAAKALAKAAIKPSELPKGPLPLESLAGIVVDDAAATKVGTWSESTFDKTYVGKGYLHDGDKNKGELTITFQPEFKKAGLYEVRLAYAGGKSRAKAVPVEILSADGEFSTKVNMTEEPPIDDRFVSLGKFHFDETNQWYLMVSNEGTKGYVTIDCVQFLPIEEAKVVVDGTKPGEKKPGDKQEKPTQVAQLEAELKKLQATAPPRPMAMAVEDAPKVGDCKLCLRGNVHSPGPSVPRGMLQIATVGPAPEIPANESGRRQLAAWITDKQNPLTARVYVNRAWHYLLGVGLVRTVDNFGTTGETPSHSRLLDYLAAQFIEDGWSTKRLVRKIVLSRTYRQSSAENAAAAKVDPENRLLWRMNRKRLDAESLRDCILVVSGKLDRKLGGPNIQDPAVLKGSGTVKPSEYDYVFADTRRSVYTPAFRNKVLDLFEAFDMADQNTVAGRRNISTGAPQALFMLNAPFVMEQARFAAERALAVDPALSDRQRIERAFVEALGRKPTDGELKIALAAVAVDVDLARSEADSDPRAAAWERFFQALLGCVDFRYLD